MSVILKDIEDGKFKIYSKGADNVMNERADNSEYGETQ